MNFLEYVGLLAIVFSSSLGFSVIGWSVVKHLRQTLDHAKRGEVETMRDVRNADRIRQEIG